MISLCVYFLMLATVFAQNSLIIANRLINTQSTYAINMVNNSYTLTPSGNLIITFPPVGYTNSQLTHASCSYSCSVSGLTITINNNLISSNPSILSVVIYNVINPGTDLSVNASSVSVSLSLTSGNTNLSISLGTFTPGTLSSCSIVFSPSITNTQSTAIITIKSSNPVSNGKIVIEFPQSYWPNNSYNISNNIINNNSLSCASNAGNLSCSYISLFKTLLTINSVSVSANNSYTVNVTTFLSPPISAANTELKAETKDTYSNSIDTQVICNIPALSPRSITFSPNITNATVNTNFNISFSFNSNDWIKVGDVIELSITSLSIVNSSPLVITNTNITSNLVLTQSTAYQYPITSSSSLEIDNNTRITLSGLSFKPGLYSQSISKAFIITIWRNTYPFLNGSIDFNIVPNIFLNSSLSTSPNIVQRSATFKISFKTVTSLLTNSLIVIRVPSSITTFSCFSQIRINSVTSNITCNKTGQNITITNFPTVLNSNTQIVIDLSATAPTTTQPLTFIISSIYNNLSYSSWLQQGVSDQVTFAYTAGTSTPICSVTPGNYTIGAITNYNISCQTMSVLPTNTVLQISIPVQIVLENIVVSVYINSTFISGTSFTNTLQSITINSAIKSNLANNSMILIVISNLRSPQNFSTSDSFTFTSSLNSYPIEYLNTNLNVNMNTSNTFSSTTVTPGSKMNGDTTTYTVTFNSSVTVFRGYVLSIIVPASINVHTPVCNSSFTCSSSNNNLSITFTQNYTYNQIVSISISNITNPRTYSPSGNFTFILYNSGVVMQNGLAIGFNNTSPNYIQNFRMSIVSPSQIYFDSIQSLKFTVQTKNLLYLNNSEYFTITIPSSYTSVADFRCLTPYSCTIIDKSIKVTANISSNTNFELTVLNLKSPYNNSNGQYFSINSYSSNNTLIDTSNSSTYIQFELSCNYPCQTCDTNKSYCKTCYTNATLVNNQCLFCSLGEYKNPSTGNCSTCDSTCKTCINSSTNCTSCLTNYLDTAISKCVSSCPNQTIPLNNICEFCSASCNNCQNSTSSCISCSSGYLRRSFTSMQCVSECDNGLVKYDGVCQCYQCLTCSGIYTNCTNCDSNSQYKYLYKNQCLVECPISTYASGSGCVPCLEGCISCTATQCLDDLQNSLSGKLIPVPFSLAIVIVGIVAIISRIMYSHTFIPSFIISIGGILQVVCWIVTVIILQYYYLTKNKATGQILILAGIGMNYVLNLINIFLFFKYLMKDIMFSFWFRKASSKIHSKLSVVFSALFSHRYIHILFSNAFESKSFSGYLDDPLKIIPTYAISGVGYISQILVIAGCGVIAYDPRTYNGSHLYMQCIDSIVINIIIMIFTTWNFIKPQGFFTPPEIRRYKDHDQFKNNETVEDLRDNYVQNLEIENVESSIGGKAKYSNTRLNLQGLNQKSLRRTKHTMVSNLITKIVEGDQDQSQQLVNNMMKRLKLEGISQTSQIDNQNTDEMEEQVQPQQAGNKRNKIAKENNIFYEYDEKSSIPISDDSLVRYEEGTPVQQANIIFIDKRKKGNITNSQALNQGENEYGIEQRADHILINQNNENVSNQQNSGLDYDPHQMPQIPVINSNQQSKLANQTFLSDKQSQPKWRINDKSHTNYSVKDPPKNKAFKRLERMRMGFNMTDAQFRQKQEHEEEQLDSHFDDPYLRKQSYEELNNIRSGFNSKPSELINNNDSNLPFHQFDRYLEDDLPIFQNNENKDSKTKHNNRAAISCSVGSIRKTKNPINLTNHQLTRQIVSKNILSPQTPIQIPRIQIPSSELAFNEPLEIINQHQGRQSLKMQNPKMKSVEKIYLQKLVMKEDPSRK